MKNTWSWIIWLVSSLMLVFFLNQQLESNDKTLFLPGQTSAGHYQIELKCDGCHGESYSDKEVMQKKCLSCHKEELKAVKDSHPKTKFTDPRNANLVKILDARYCMTCHVEHNPEITQKMGVTQPQGYCINCHLEIAEDRPSHEGMGFETCASAGCHNYHDNRALYEDFLVKHANEPKIKLAAEMPAVDVHSFYYQRNKETKSLTTKDSDAPEKISLDSKIMHDWEASSHAIAGVNCSACHSDKKNKTWIEKPGLEQCQSCHQIEAKGFLEGKHGMRLKSGLTPMQPKYARIELNQLKADKQLGCVSCHRDHDFDLRKAAVEACSGCHIDEHTLNYKKSPHYQLWQQTQNGLLDKKKGVSCATCHMPALEQKAEFNSAIATQHNQNANLRPNEKMIRSVCLQCHSLAFSIDALADEILINKNFNGQPAIHINSVDMAVVREK